MDNDNESIIKVIRNLNTGDGLIKKAEILKVESKLKNKAVLQLEPSLNWFCMRMLKNNIERRTIRSYSKCSSV